MDHIENSPAPKPTQKVTLRHPHTGDIQEEDATPEDLIPLMCLGYVQDSPVSPAQGA